MSSKDIEKHRKTAEVYNENDLCKKKIIELLEEFSFPKGLMPLEDIIEIGHDRSSGFTWALQKRKVEHIFQKIGLKASYDTVITAFVEKRRIRKITGCKAREFLIWASASEMYIDEKSPEKLNVKGPAGLCLSFPVSAFELEEGSG